MLQPVLARCSQERSTDGTRVARLVLGIFSSRGHQGLRVLVALPVPTAPGATLCKPHFSTPADTGMSFDVVKDQELAILGAGTSDEYLRSPSSAKED